MYDTKHCTDGQKPKRIAMIVRLTMLSMMTYQWSSVSEPSDMPRPTGRLFQLLMTPSYIVSVDGSLELGTRACGAA